MTDPTVTISWGELFDRLSILEIKQTRLASAPARAIAAAQLSRLGAIAASLDLARPSLVELRASLKAINEQLWTIEDEIRSHEARNQFDARFVELARSVYRNNDERARLKAAIDRLLGSESEPKEYAPYEVQVSKPNPVGSSP